MTEVRTLCHTPTPGKKPTSIPTWKYRVVREAILKVVPAEEPGILAKALPEFVSSLLEPRARQDLGSITWHTTTVKLHLEVEGEIRRVARSKPQRIVRAGPARA